jgi:hypothetical protein
MWKECSWVFEKQYGDWHTFDSVTHSSMGADTRLILWLTAVWGLTHVWFCDSQQYGYWHTFDSVTHSSMGSDTRLILWLTAVWGLTQGDDSIIDMILRYFMFILSHCFELPSQNCCQTSTRPCDFCRKPVLLRQKQQTSNYWRPLCNDASNIPRTFFQSLTHTHTHTHIYIYIYIWRNVDENRTHERRNNKTKSVIEILLFN